MSYNYPIVATQLFGSVTLIGASLAGIAWAVPLAATDLLGVTGFRVPVSWGGGVTQWRLVGQLTAVAGGTAVFGGLYSTTAGGALVTLGAGNLSATALGVAAGAWTAIPAAAKTDTFVTVQGSGGDGLTVGILAFLGIQFR